MMDRDNPVLKNIREALANRGNMDKASTNTESARLIENSLSQQEKTALFKERAESSGAKVHVVERVEHLRDRLEEIIPDGAKLTVANGEEIENRLGPIRSWFPDSCEQVDLDPQPDSEPKSQVIRDKLFNIDAALTRVVAAVAETGSVVLEAGPDHARLVSLTAEKHIALVWPDQIVADLLDWSQSMPETTTAKLAGSPDGNTGNRSAGGFTMISGPSKTADIELQLVTGVHGPKELHLIIIHF